MRSCSPGGSTGAVFPTALQPIGTVSPAARWLLRCTTPLMRTSLPLPRRCVKHRSASGNEDLILKSAPDNMSVRADEAVVSNAQRMARRASENGVLHDDALAADTYWSSLGDNLALRT